MYKTIEFILKEEKERGCLHSSFSIGELADVMEDYNKVESKELIETCKLALHFCDRLRPPTEHELEALRVDLIRALVKYS